MRRDMRRFRPFRIGEPRLGWVRDDFARELRRFPAVFAVADDAVRLAPNLLDFDSRSRAVDGALRQLREEGRIPGWREEAFPVAASFHEAPLLRIERAAAPLFGILAYGVHVIGMVGEGEAARLWIARRSRLKAVGPGKLDHISNGGLPIGLDPRQTLIKECAEEAGIPAALARAARPASVISYLFEDAGGLRDEINFVFDLAVPEDFIPRNVDGEVEEFQLWPVDRVRRILEESDEFLYDAALGLVDLLIRRGWLSPEQPDYLDILHGLRSRVG
jgi:8-oxo-dGTP pyrophosphatase MutT (NUDIX family)